MKQWIIVTIIVLLLCCTCSILLPENYVSAITMRGTVLQEQSTVIRMSDLQIIKLAADHLKEQKELVSFQETMMILHDGSEDPDSLLVMNGQYIEYDGAYLEIKLYSNPEYLENYCEDNFTVYIAVNGNILGYYKN